VTEQAQESPMKITGLAPWFGAKRTLAYEIAKECGPHRTWWEVFCASMSMTLILPPCSMETVCDLHGDIINMARIIRDPKWGAQFYRRLRRTLMHEQFFAECDRVIRQGERDGTSDRLADAESLGEEALERAYRYFVVSWMGRNGTAGTPASHKGTFCVRYTNKGGHAGRRWSGAVGSIPAWRRRLRDVTILHRDSFGLLERIADERGTVLYCDPPYIEKGATYLHDFTPEQHDRLAGLLRRFHNARVVVSYYDHPRLAELYPGWTIRRLNATKAMAHAGMRDNTGRIDAPEVLLINGPSLVADANMLFA
jgi:DNA adenine methylase